MKNKIFFISFIIVVIYFLSAVSAADVNCTCDNLEINGENTLELSDVDEVCDNSSAYDTLGVVSDECNDCDGLSADNECLGDIEIHSSKLSTNNIEIYGPIYSNCKDYNELQKLIYDHCEVDLNRDYSISADVPFNINKNVDIDGHGHSIKFNDKSVSSFIQSSAGNIILKNLKISGGHHRGDGGVLFFGGSSCLTLINCTFYDNIASGKGGAVYINNKNRLKIINCTFSCNSAYCGGAVYSKGDVEIINSTISDNQVNSKYAAVFCEGHLWFTNSFSGGNTGVDLSRNSIDGAKGCSIDNYASNKNIVYDVCNKDLKKQVVNFWVNDTRDLNNILSILHLNNPVWQVVNITLAPNTVFEPYSYDVIALNWLFLFKVVGKTIIINGNSGSVIHSARFDNTKNFDFAYIAPNAQFILSNVLVEGFNNCLVNNGMVYCINSTFHSNKNVCFNNNMACFENCYFIGNSGEHSVLEASEKSFNTFISPTISPCGVESVSIGEDAHLVFFSSSPINNFENFKLCSSIVSVISIKKSFENTCVFNCSDETQLKSALNTINTFMPNVRKIIINLEPKVYKLDSKNIGSLNTDYNSFLDVTCLPVVINGNGATIECNDDDAYKYFACIGQGNLLIVNNVTFSKFHTVFKNRLGNLSVNNCGFINNSFLSYLSKSPNILYMKGGQAYFNNCSFKKNGPLFNLKQSELHINYCEFDKFLSPGWAYQCDIHCPSEFKSKWAVNSAIGCLIPSLVRSANFCSFHINDDVSLNNRTYHSERGLFVNVHNQSAFSKMARYSNILKSSRIFMNISCDGRLNLDFEDNVNEVYIFGNGHKISGDSLKIKKAMTIHFINLTFENYNCDRIFENDGNLLFDHCNFTNNRGCLILNRGVCIFDSCLFVKNVLKKDDSYLIYNEGSLTISNSSFVGCSLHLIHNNCSVLIRNSNAPNHGWIYNLKTENCEICNSSGFFSKISYPDNRFGSNLDMWKKIIRTSLFTIVAASGFIPGFLVAYYSTSVLFGVGVGLVTGVAVSAGAAFIDAKITGADFGTMFPLYLSLGILSGVLGGLVGGLAAMPAWPTYDPKDAVVETFMDDYLIPGDIGFVP